MQHKMGDDPLPEDTVLIHNITLHLQSLGYVGPDLLVGDVALQDDKLIVLEAPEEFNTFAESRGWKDLAAEFEGDDEEIDAAAPAATAQLDALMRKFKST
jgi:hypothetical protein